MNQSNSRLSLFLSGLMLTLVMSFFLIYANIDYKINLFGVELKKNKDLKLKADKKKAKKQDIQSTEKPKDSIVQQVIIDTASKRFMLIGDSQVGGLMNPFYDYCKFNNHELAYVLVWNSSTDITYATTDTLKSLLQIYKPDHVVMVIGLNQIYQRTFDASEESVKKIISMFKGISYSWVGPANWVPDYGVNEMYQNTVDPGCFFLSKNLVLQRASDGRHPSRAASFIWMDSIAGWMQNKSIHHIKMNKPDTVYKYRTYKIGVLNAADFQKKKTTEKK